VKVLEYARATFLLAHVDRYAFLVARQATKPRTRPVNIQFAPHAQRISTTRRFDLDNLSAEMPTNAAQQYGPIAPSFSMLARGGNATTHPSSCPVKGPAMSCPSSRTRTPDKGRLLVLPFGNEPVALVAVSPLPIMWNPVTVR